jgi:hypothetical protein
MIDAVPRGPCQGPRRQGELSAPFPEQFTVLSDVGSWGSDRLVCPVAFIGVARARVIYRLAMCDTPSAKDRGRLAPSGTDDLSGLTLQSHYNHTTCAQ